MSNLIDNNDYINAKDNLNYEEISIQINIGNIPLVAIPRKIVIPQHIQRQPSLKYVELIFKSKNLSYIEFINFNVYALLIQQYNDLSKEYVTVLDRIQLMSTPYSTRSGNNDKFRLSTIDFNHNFNIEKLISLRLLLLQPSPMWDKFELRDIKAYTRKLIIAPPLITKTTDTHVSFTSLDETLSIDYKRMLEATDYMEELSFIDSVIQSERFANSQVEQYSAPHKNKVGKKKDKTN